MSASLNETLISFAFKNHRFFTQFLLYDEDKVKLFSDIMIYEYTNKCKMKKKIIPWIIYFNLKLPLYK